MDYVKTKERQIVKKGFFTVRGNDLPMRSIYKQLKIMWLNEMSGRTNKKLADLIGVTPQMASTYASGTENRTPPFSSILMLCRELKLEVVIRPNCIFIQGVKEPCNRDGYGEKS